MAIKRFSDYEKTQTYGDFQRLPKGGYIGKVTGVELCGSDKGQYIKLALDIADGEYAGFFTKQYKEDSREDRKWGCIHNIFIPTDADEEWKKRRFKTTIADFEDSNKGFHWDWEERDLKGLLIGLVFIERDVENNGKISTYTGVGGTTTVEKIKTGTYRQLEDKKITPKNSSAAGVGGWMDTSNEKEEDLPFN